MNDGTSTNRPGFTLLEMLIVLGIIALLIGMLMPALQRVRTMSDKIECGSNMRQIGVAYHSYSQAYGYYPKAARIPSQSPEEPSLAQVLSYYVENQEEIFRCPSDSEYFDKEGLSYEYVGAHLGGKSYNFIEGLSHLTRLLTDFSHFHGPEDSRASRNVLYGDGRVR